MSRLDKEVFVCVDCEMTGLDIEKDQIIEIAAVKFTLNKILEKKETLVKPTCDMSQEAQEIHGLSLDDLKDAPLIQDVLPDYIKFIGQHIIVGHAVGFDLKFMKQAAKTFSVPHALDMRTVVDTLRLARLYGQCKSNSLSTLREHFEIENLGAHRAMNDVLVNIEVFKELILTFKTTNQVLNRLEKPIPLKFMPFGKHKGRPFSELPTNYLKWAVMQDFDGDLMFTIKQELKKRKKGSQFSQASNPFGDL